MCRIADEQCFVTGDASAQNHAHKTRAVRVGRQVDACLGTGHRPRAMCAPKKTAPVNGVRS